MMTSMRKMAGGFMAKLLMLFLVITFGVWGIGDIFRSSSSDYAAKVGGQTITIGEFEQQRSQVTSRAEAAGVKDINSSALNVGILRQLVQRKLVGLTLHDLGLYANETLLAKSLRAEPAFRNKDGSFSKINFINVLKANRLSEAALLAQVKEDISEKFLLSSLDASDISPPASVRKLEAATALETRDAWVLTIPPISAPTVTDEAALKEFYEKNKAVLYVKPESRTLEYVTLRPQQIEALIDASITSQMIADAKKTQPQATAAEIKTRLRREQRESVLHDAQGALDDALASGTPLNEALTKAGLSAPIRTLTDIKESTMGAQDAVTKTVTEQGFDMGDGETSSILMTPDGTPLIVHVKSLQLAGAAPYEEVAADVRKRVAEQQRRDATRARVQEVREALNTITGAEKNITNEQLKTVLTRFNLTAQQMNGLKRPQSASNASGIPTSLLQAIFERQVGTVAGPLTLPTGGQMLAIVAATHQPDVAAVEAQSKRVFENGAPAHSELLTQTVQARSFGSFAERHRVKINAKLLSVPVTSADDQP